MAKNICEQNLNMFFNKFAILSDGEICKTKKSVKNSY